MKHKIGIISITLFTLLYGNFTISKNVNEVLAKNIQKEDIIFSNEVSDNIDNVKDFQRFSESNIFDKSNKEEQIEDILFLEDKILDKRFIFNQVERYLYANKNNVKYYSSPLKEEQLGILKAFEPIKVIGENETNMLQVMINNNLCYVEKENFSNNLDEIFLPINKTMYAKQKINVRKESHPDSKLISSYRLNDEVIVVGENKTNFVQVKLKNNKIGYVWKEYLTDKKVQKQNGGYIGKVYSIPNDYQYQVVLATIRHEGGDSYEGALGVMSCVLNRCDSGKWGGGKDPYKNIIARGQFESYFAGYYKQFMNYNVSKEVRQAVEDALNGKRSHNFERFRTYSKSIQKQYPNGINIKGNWHF